MDRVVMKKELCHCGTFVNPSSGKFILSPERLSRWQTTGKEMLTAGLKMPLRKDGHESSTCGWITDLSVEDNKLFVMLELIGEEAELKASTLDISLEAGDFTDGTGKKWEDVITAAALTDRPTIPGMQPAIKIIASLDGQVLTYTEEQDMDLTPITAELGVDKPELILDAIKALKVKTIAEQPKVIDELTLSLANETYTNRLNALKNAGKITTHVQNKLGAVLIGTNNANLKLALVEPSFKLTLDGILAALAENESVVPMVEMTNAQVLPDAAKEPTAREKLDAAWKKLVNKGESK